MINLDLTNRKYLSDTEPEGMYRFAEQYGNSLGVIRHAPIKPS